MSRSTSKRARWRRSQASKRCRLIRRLAIILDRERFRRWDAVTPIMPGEEGLRGLWPTGWPYGGGTTGTIGGRFRALDIRTSDGRGLFTDGHRLIATPTAEEVMRCMRQAQESIKRRPRRSVPAGTYGRSDVEIIADEQRVLALEQIKKLYPAGTPAQVDDSAIRLIRDHYRELADRNARKNRRL